MKSFVIFILTFMSFFAEAKDPEPGFQGACRDTIETYCAKERASGDLREIVKCLARNDENLPVSCKQELERFGKASRQTAPPGGGPVGALAGLTGAASQVPSLTYEGRHILPGQDRHDSKATYENSLSFSVPFFKNEKNTYSATFSGGTHDLGEDILLDSGRVVPEHLYRAEVGLGYARKLEKMKNFGVRASLGYAGDEISSKTQSYTVIANYAFPAKREGSVWVWMIYLSNNSPLGTFVPVPGFFYLYRTPTFTGLFGLPVASMQWTPVKPWSFSLSLFATNVRAEAAYGLFDTTQIYAGAGTRQQKFLIADIEDKDERLTLEEKTLEAGLRHPLFKAVFAELSAGYAFDRYVYEGDGLYKKDGGRANLDASAFVKWSFRLAF